MSNKLRYASSVERLSKMNLLCKQKSSRIREISECNKLEFYSDIKSEFEIQGVSKTLLYSGEQYIVVSLFSFVFPRCLTRRVINASRIVLFKSTIKLNNLSSDKKHNFIIGRLIFTNQ